MSEREESVRRPRRHEVIGRALEALARRMPKSMPAKVVRVDPSQRFVDCKVLVMRPFFDEEDERQVESIPVVTNVGLMLPPYYSAPISDGTLVFGNQLRPATTGMLVWCDRSIDKWLTGNGAEVDPEVDHDNSLADAWFCPGLFASGAVPFAIPQGYIVIGDDSGSDFVALAAKVKAWFDAFNSAVSGWTPVSNDGGAALKSALTTLIGGTPSTDVAASQVKAK